MGGIFYLDGFHVEMDMIPEATTDFGMFGILLAVRLLLMFFAMPFSIVCYVFQSYGFYTIASRRGIRNSWLAWVPVGNVWILGSISDQYQYVAKGKVKNRRKLLLGLSIALLAVYVGLVVVLVVGMLISESAGFGAGAIVTVLLVLLAALALVAIAIAMLVIQYICLYDLYKSCDPDDAGLFLVLSILFSLAMPFFIFSCRKKDLGMPPKKQPAAEPVIENEAEEPAEEPVMEEGYAQPEEFEEE